MGSTVFDFRNLTLPSALPCLISPPGRRDYYYFVRSSVGGDELSLRYAPYRAREFLRKGGEHVSDR